MPKKTSRQRPRASDNEQSDLKRVTDDSSPSSSSQPAAGDSDGELSVYDLPAAEATEPNVVDIPLDDIAELSNVRSSYHGIEELAESIYTQGQLQPCLVRPALNSEAHGKQYELIFGYRRLRALRALNERDAERWGHLRCSIQAVDDGQQLATMIVENFQREQPSPVAEARAMWALKHSTSPPLSNAEIGRRLGCHRSQVGHRLQLLELGSQKALPPAQKPPPQMKSLPAASQDADPASGEDADEPDAESTRKEVLEGPVEVEIQRDVDAEEPESGDQAEAAAQPAADKTPSGEEIKLDILALVDSGEISASTAEVIAGLEKRADQEQLAKLVKQHGWSTRRAASWARQLKTSAEKAAQLEDLGPVEFVTADDSVELPRLRLKEKLSKADVDRLAVWALLRNGMDREMLLYLERERGYAYEDLWGFAGQLSSEQARALLERLVRRYTEAAHRFPSIEKELRRQLGTSEIPEHIKAAAPASEDDSLLEDLGL